MNDVFSHPDALKTIADARGALEAEIGKPRLAQMRDLVIELSWETNSFELRKLSSGLQTYPSESNLRRVVMLDALSRFLSLVGDHEGAVATVLKGAQRQRGT